MSENSHEPGSMNFASAMGALDTEAQQRAQSKEPSLFKKVGSFFSRHKTSPPSKIDSQPPLQEPMSIQNIAEPLPQPASSPSISKNNAEVASYLRDETVKIHKDQGVTTDPPAFALKKAKNAGVPDEEIEYAQALAGSKKFPTPPLTPYVSPVKTVSTRQETGMSDYEAYQNKFNKLREVDEKTNPTPTQTPEPIKHASGLDDTNFAAIASNMGHSPLEVLKMKQEKNDALSNKPKTLEEKKRDAQEVLLQAEKDEAQNPTPQTKQARIEADRAFAYAVIDEIREKRPLSEKLMERIPLSGKTFKEVWKEATTPEKQRIMYSALASTGASFALRAALSPFAGPLSGTIVGGAVAGGKEYWKQSSKLYEKEGVTDLREKLKKQYRLEVFKSGGKQVVGATIQGAVIGTAGGVIGNWLGEQLVNYMPTIQDKINSLTNEIAQVGDKATHLSPPEITNPLPDLQDKIHSLINSPVAQTGAEPQVPLGSDSAVPSSTPSITEVTPTPTATQTPDVTSTVSHTSTPTFITQPTETMSSVGTGSMPTETVTPTHTPEVPTATSHPTETLTPHSTETVTTNPTSTPDAIATVTHTPTPTASPTADATPSMSPTPDTATHTPTAAPTVDHTPPSAPDSISPAVTPEEGMHPLPSEPTPPAITPEDGIHTEATLHITGAPDRIQVPAGSSFWESFKLDSGPGWENPATGAHQQDVMRQLVSKFALGHGIDLSHIQPGIVDMNTLNLTPDEIEFLNEVMHTGNVQQYMELLHNPKYAHLYEILSKTQR